MGIRKNRQMLDGITPVVAHIAVARAEIDRGTEFTAKEKKTRETSVGQQRPPEQNS